MGSNLLILKKIFIFLCVKSAKSIYTFFKSSFSEKKIVYVSNKKIKSYSIGSIGQISVFLFAIWVTNLFSQSLLYTSILEEKTTQINDLRAANGRFEKEVISLNVNLKKIDNYFSSISGYEQIPLGNDADQNLKSLNSKKFKDIFANLNLGKEDKKTAFKIANSNAILDNIKNAAKKRIADLENKISISGLNITNNTLAISNQENIKNNPNKPITILSLNNQKDLERKQGGPFQEIEESSNSTKTESVLGRVDIGDEIKYLSELEKFIQYAPLAKPMKKYYISSNFGKRVDPIKKVSAIHNGMDFAGRKGEKIISPSLGRVKLARTFGAYGKTIIIDHGYGITSRYGHLSKIKVKKGDFVKKGDIIAIQGNSGRSTGSHLHYEVRYKKSALNPKKFLRAGEEIFNNDFEI